MSQSTPTDDFMSSTIQLPDKPSELKYPRYFRSKDKYHLLRFDDATNGVWLKRFGQVGNVKAYLLTVDECLERCDAGEMQEITESEAKELLQKHEM